MPLLGAVLLLCFLCSCDVDTSSQRPQPVVLVSIERATVRQHVTLFLDTGEVNRTFGTVDASFVMHHEDHEFIISLIEKVNVEEECSSNGPTMAPVLTYRRGMVEEKCGLAGLQSLLDSFLLIPERTMPWPFEPQDAPHPVGHTVNSFQDYSPIPGDEYFHPGVDIMASEYSSVYNVLPGRVVKAGYYDLSGGNAQDPMYFEVVVNTQNGIVVQYHHIDPTSVSDEVKESLQNGTILPVGAKIGFIVSWPIVETGYSNEPFHHLHLNTFTRDLLPLNGLQLLIPHPDERAPRFNGIFLVDAARTTVLDPDALTDDFRVVVEVYDLMDGNVWPLPPRRYEVRVGDERGETILKRAGYDYVAALSPVKEDFVCDYYLCGDAGMVSVGDYGERRMFVEATAFDKAGAKAPPITRADVGHGKRVLSVSAYDEYENCSVLSLSITLP